MPKIRPGLVSLLSLVFLAAMSGIRLMLGIMSPHEAALNWQLLPRIAGTGLLFDLAALSCILLPLALYLMLVPRRIAASSRQLLPARLCFALFAGLLLFDACAEYLFFREFGTRFNFIAVDYLIYTREVIGNIRESYPLGAIFSGIGVAALLVVRLLHRPIDAACTLTFSGSHRRNGALLAASAALSLATVNVGLSTVPGNNFATELAGNGIYNLAAAFRNNELDFARFYRTSSDKAVLARLHGLVEERNNHYVDEGSGRFTRHITAEGPEKRLNLIVVVEESLSAEYLEAFGSRKGLTPNLDRLADESLLFTNLYATGTRTVRGLEALTLSIPPLPGTSIVKRPDNGGFRSWGEILRAKGYDTKFIYAGYGYFDNMNAFFSGNGFSVVDRGNFAADEVTFANIWGVCDEDLFRKTIREADVSHASGRPFFSMLMTTSNHRPFTYPDGRIDIPSRKGRKGGVKYADYAIGRFIAEASRQPWFRDTIFVFVADHCADSAGKTEIPVKKYEIPMLVYSPEHIGPGIVNRLMSQIDIAPTILGLMNMSYDTDFLGKDVLKDHGEPRAFVSTYQKLGYLTEDRLAVLGPQRYSAAYRIDRRSGVTSPLPLEDSKIDDMLAYYQGANYLYKNRLNRLR